jgi:hypothetical protein
MMRSRTRSLLAVVTLTVAFVVAFASPASAETKPQLIDGSEDGALAFVAFAAMCMVFVALLFAVDKVRQKAEDERDKRDL